MRLFLAVLLPEPLRERLDRWTASWKERLPAVRWAPSSAYHVTLRFFGEVVEERVAALRLALRAALAGRRAFAAALSETGAFAAADGRRVLWAGVGTGREDMAALNHAAEAAAQAAGLPPEARLYHPHVTLGRAGPGASAPGWGGPLAGGPGGFPVEAVHLMRSQLRPQGAAHTTLDVFPLTL